MLEDNQARDTNAARPGPGAPLSPRGRLRDGRGVIPEGGGLHGPEVEPVRGRGRGRGGREADDPEGEDHAENRLSQGNEVIPIGSAFVHKMVDWGWPKNWLYERLPFRAPIQGLRTSKLVPKIKGHIFFPKKPIKVQSEGLNDSKLFRFRHKLIVQLQITSPPKVGLSQHKHRLSMGVCQFFHF